MNGEPVTIEKVYELIQAAADRGERQHERLRTDMQKGFTEMREQITLTVEPLRKDIAKNTEDIAEHTSDIDVLKDRSSFGRTASVGGILAIWSTFLGWWFSRQ